LASDTKIETERGPAVDSSASNQALAGLYVISLMASALNKSGSYGVSSDSCFGVMVVRP
jgi:hypothetical protein